MNAAEELKCLLDEISKKEHILSKLNFLCARESELVEETSRLRTDMEIEEAEAADMGKPGITTFFYTLIGKWDERLAKEKQEAADATEKYRLAVSELDEISSDIEKCRKELRHRLLRSQ